MLKLGKLTLAFLLGTGTLAFSLYGQENSHPDWMGKNQEKLQNLTLNQIVLLGSHDASSCDIHEGSLPVSGYLTHHQKHIHRLAKEKDLGSARCQSATITEQLHYGVRYLDMRIAHQEGQYWGTHMWLSTPAFGEGGVFTQIKTFLAEHPGELILLNFNGLYGENKPMNREQMESFYNKLEKELGDLLAPRGNFSKTCLAEIWQGNGRIIAIGDKETNHEFIWDRRKVDDQWMNEEEPEACFAKLSQVLAAWSQGESNDKLTIKSA